VLQAKNGISTITAAMYLLFEKIQESGTPLPFQLDEQQTTISTTVRACTVVFSASKQVYIDNNSKRR
jgi:hypothetical protein